MATAAPADQAQAPSRKDRIAAMGPVPAPPAPPAPASTVTQVEQTRASIAMSLAYLLQSFMDKPGLSTALMAALFSVLCALGATFTAWWGVDFRSSSPSISGVTRFTVWTTEARYCGTSALAAFPRRFCVQYDLSDAPSALSYLYAAGSASLALIILSLPVSLLALYLTLLRRRGTLTLIIPARLQALTSVWATVGLHAANAFLLLIAFAQFAGAVNGASLDTVISASGGGTGPTTDISSSFSAGFALAVMGCLLAVLAGGLIYYFANGEQSRLAPSAQFADNAKIEGAMAGAYGNDDAPAASAVSISVGGAAAAPVVKGNPLQLAGAAPLDPVAAGPPPAVPPRAARLAPASLAPTPAFGETPPPPPREAGRFINVVTSPAAMDAPPPAPEYGDQGPVV